VLASVAVRDDDGDAVSGDAVPRSTDAARHQRRVLPDDVRLDVVVSVGDVNEHTSL